MILIISSPEAKSDIVTLKDGTTYEGVVVSENRAEVVLEITIANIKTTKTFTRYKVRSIEYKPVEGQSEDETENEAEDERTSTTTASELDDDESIDESEADDERLTPAERLEARRNRVLYMVIPVEGMIGLETNATGLRNALIQGRRKKAQHVVFTIDSGGGYVYDAVETLKVLKEFDGDFEYHALIEEGAISAASVYVAAADKIWVRPGSRVGGAVAYRSDNSSGAAEVDAKFNSIWAAEIASRAQSKGHPPEVFRAMVEPGAEVWIDDEGKIYPSRPSSRGAQQLDNSTTIFTMRADQIVEAKMGQLFEGELEDLGELLDISSWAEMRGAGQRAMETAGRERIMLSERLEEAAKVFVDALEAYQKDDPRSFDDYRFYLQRNGTYMADGPSVQRWRERCDTTVRHCDIMLQALARVAEVNKRADKIGALHLNVLPNDIGHDTYTVISDDRLWLIDNRSRVPQP